MTRRDLMAETWAFGVLGAPPAVISQDSPPRAPDLGNLHEFVTWVSNTNPPRLSFLGAEWKSLEQWKRVARPLFREHLRYSPEPAPLGASVIAREERDGFSVETVRIRATSGYDIPAWVLIPAKRNRRGPAVLAMHCHSGRYTWGHEKVVSDPNEPEALTSFRERAYGRAYGEVLARRGFVVISIDAFYFGQRRFRPEEMTPAAAPPYIREDLTALARLKRNTEEWFKAVNTICSRHETITAKTLLATGITWPGILIWDDMRTVDYLASRPEVDPGRIGCVGLSIGGLRTAHLIAADPRIKAACVTGWMTEFREQLRNHLNSHTWMAYIPGLYASLDLPDAAALIAPGVLLVQQCSRDALYPMSGMKGAVEKLSKIYAKAGLPERFRSAFYDVPHSFRPEMQDEAFDWLERWL